jgi:hypothetical protein
VDDPDAGVGLGELAGIGGALLRTPVHRKGGHRSAGSEEGVPALQQRRHVAGQVVGLGGQPGHPSSEQQKHEQNSAAHAPKFAPKVPAKNAVGREMYAVGR